MMAFDRHEYQDRIDRTKAAMSRHGIDVLLCSDPANMNYLTGYDGWSFYVHQMVVLGLEAAEPIWIGRAMDAAGARLTTYLDRSDIVPYPEDYIDAPDRHPMVFAARVLKSRSFGRERIGVEMDNWYFTARACEVLRESLPNAAIVDAFALVNQVRLVKSPAEIGLMRGAAAIVAAAMTAGIDAIAPGVRECDVASRIAAAQFAGTAEYWGDYPAALAQAPSGIKTAAPHLTWSDDRYGDNTVTYLELAGCHRRYHALLARTICLGAPPQWLRKMIPVVEEGLESALSAATAGKTCEDVESAWRRVIARAGYEKVSRIGYSVGLGYPPDWGERTASLRQGDRTILEENMCFHVILGMWAEDSGYEISETIRITADGVPELLTRFPRDLVVKA